MKKVLDKDLERKLTGMKPTEVIDLLRELQDGSGLKICQVLTKGDPAIREVK